MPYLVGYITPQDYGALANGVNDDTSAIQAAITAAGTAGKAVFFPATNTGYLLNGVGLTVSSDNVSLIGESVGNSKLVIGASFSGSAVVTITGTNCRVQDLDFAGASGTITSNPAAGAITVSAGRRTKINRCLFEFVNGWCIQVLSTSGSGTSNPRGTQIGQIYVNQCAGGVKFLGNTTQAYQMNCSITDMQMASSGVATGGSANLDAIRIEDAWDVLVENAIVWLSAGTGSAFHVKGNCAATFVTNLDALGPGSTGPNVLIEDSANGSPQNVQITGGVIQQGSIGMQVTGGATHVRLNTSRIINNSTHGISIANTAGPVYLTNVFFSLNGQGAAGTNYDLNWSGAATGAVSSCYFASPITSIGVAGVQDSVNIASAQDVMFVNVTFSGAAASSSNWFTNTPGGVLMTNNQRFNFRTRVDFNGQIAAQPSASGNTVISGNVSGTDSFDRLRVLGDGTLSVGPGTTGRDVQLQRTGVGVWSFTDPLTAHAFVGIMDGNLVVGGTAALGDNGVGEIQLANATTVPTTNPTAGVSIYAASASAVPIKLRDVAGNVRGLVPAFALSSADQTSVGTAQTASNVLIVAVEANATYVIRAYLYWTTINSATVTTSWSTTATSSTMIWNDTTTGGDVVTTLAGVSPAWATGNKMVQLFGTLLTAGTAGNLTFTFASSVAASVTIKPTSILIAERIK